MAEAVVLDVASLVLQALKEEIIRDTRYLWGVKREISNLESSILRLKALLSEGEKHQGDNHVPRTWVQKLKYVLNEADDLLYDISAVKLEKKKLKGGTIGRKVRHYFSSSNPLAFHCWIAFKIKAINKKLNEFETESRNFDLPKSKSVTHREEAFSHVDRSDAIGRLEDKEKIIEILIQPTIGHDVSVLPIVGIGGLGKTKLAMLVYEDERISRQFELKLWAYVQNFDLKKLAREIIYVHGKSQTEYRMDDLNDLLNELSELLRGKRYLLVLDNVWKVDEVAWIRLKHLFMRGANGSRIIVTTRRDEVAKIMGTIPPFELDGLSDKDSLSLFSRIVFRDRPHSLPFKDIGEEIVKKCAGVPLAIKVMAMMLSSYSTKEDWITVRDCEIWEAQKFHDDILPILKLSYDSLSPDLRQCLKYCSFFPKDYEFNSFELIQFWDAFGLIKSKDAYEAIGMEYLKNLCSVFLLKECKQEFFYSKFKIPQLIHDMALYLVHDEYKMVKPSTQIINKRIRNLLFVSSKFPRQHASELLDNIGSIQTLIFIDQIEESLVESFIQRCQQLRVLILRNSGLKALPRGIGGLKRLKYLDLTGNKRVKKIPDSICMLHNLQTLMLDGCADLEELPRDIRNLSDLGMLSITTKQRFLPENGLGRLKSLRLLAIIGCQNLKYLPQGIHLLTSLRTLIIRDCDSLISLPRSMKYLIALETLVIANCRQIYLNRKMELDGEGNYYQGHLNASGLGLHRFWIASLPQLFELPQWLVRKSATTLRCLHIEDCQSIKSIPEWLMDLKLLEDLEILKCPNLSLSPGIINFTAFEKAKIEGCPRLTQQIFASQSVSDFQITKSSIRGVLEGSRGLEKGKGMWAENESDSFEAAQPASGKVRRRHTI